MDENQSGVTTSAPSDAGVISTVGANGSSLTTTDTSLAPSSTASTPTAENVQGQQSSEGDADPFELTGLPTDQELEAAETVSKKAFLQIKGAFDPLKASYKELQKWQDYVPHLERFEKPEQLQEAVSWHDKLFGSFERDERNQLVPATETIATEIAQRDPLVADYLAADLMNMETRHPSTGQMVPRIDLAIEMMRDDPERRATALRLLGGVEPSQIAPTWQPSADELNAIPRDPERITPEDKALQDIYRALPYDERESLKLNDPEFIRNYLKKERFQQNLMRENAESKQRDQAENQRREVYMAQRAEQAGNEYVETQFRQGFTEFANSVVERTNFIKPLDPQSPEAQAMAPEQVTQFNQQAQQINTGVGKMVATVTAALSHPDTRWFAMDFLKSIGVDEQTITAFDKSRTEFAQNAREYGELNFTRTAGQSNGQSANLGGLGALQSNATQAMKSLRGQANLVSKPLIQLLSQFFEMKAGSYNQSLNGGSVRPGVNGNHFTPATETPAPPRGWQSKQEIDRLYG